MKNSSSASIAGLGKYFTEASDKIDGFRTLLWGTVGFFGAAWFWAGWRVPFFMDAQRAELERR